MTLDQAIASQHRWDQLPVLIVPVVKQSPKSQQLRINYNAHKPEWVKFARETTRTVAMLQEHMRHLSGHQPTQSTTLNWVKACNIETEYLGCKTGLAAHGPEMLRMRQAGAHMDVIIEYCKLHDFDVGSRQITSAISHEKRKLREGGRTGRVG